MAKWIRFDPPPTGGSAVALGPFATLRRDGARIIGDDGANTLLVSTYTPFSAPDDLKDVWWLGRRPFVGYRIADAPACPWPNAARPDLSRLSKLDWD